MRHPYVIDMSIHHFDLARFMTGADPVAVYALEFNPKGSWYKGDVAASCIFEMSNGVVFSRTKPVQERDMPPVTLATH